MQFHEGDHKEPRTISIIQERGYVLKDTRQGREVEIALYTLSAKTKRIKTKKTQTTINNEQIAIYKDHVKNITNQIIVEDITANLNADPRISTEEILVTEADRGIAIQATITYVPLNITEKLRFNFDENSLLRLS